MNKNTTYSLDNIFFPSRIRGSENTPILALSGKIENSAQIIFIEAGQGTFKRKSTSIIPGYVEELYYRMQVSGNGSMAVLFPPRYQSGEILTCTTNAKTGKVDVQSNDSRGLIINAIFFSDASRESSLLALNLRDRMQICSIGKTGLEVQREVRWELDDDTGDDISVSESRDLCCVPDLGGVKVFQIAGKMAKLVQTLEYSVSGSVLYLQLERLGEVDCLFFSEMGGPLRAFRCEGGRFIQIWEYSIKGGHVIEAKMRDLGSRAAEGEERISLLVSKLEPAQSMSHHILGINGERISVTELTSDGCPPVSGLFNNGKNIFYSHMNERAKKAEILVAAV